MGSDKAHLIGFPSPKDHIPGLVVVQFLKTLVLYILFHFVIVYGNFHIN